MKFTGRYCIGSANAIRVRKQWIEFGFSEVPVPDPVQPALPNACISRFAGDQVAENMALSHSEKGEIVFEDCEDICRKFIFWNHAAPGDIARVFWLNFRQ